MFDWDLNNLLLFIDLVVLPPAIDLVFWRQVTTLLSLSVLLYGFIWEAD